MALVKFGPFPLGANNMAPDYALPTNERGRQIAARRIVNADVLPSGHLRRRAGMTAVQAMTGAHSLWSDGARTFLVRDSVLYRVTSFAPYAETLVKLLASNDRMTYVAQFGEVWCSNGTDIGRISDAGAWEPHALPVPPAPTLSAAAGSLAAGKYQVALTYTNASGEEGGAVDAGIALNAAGGISVDLPTAVSGATHINIYLSRLNGGLPRYHSDVPVGTASVTLTTDAAGRALQTDNLEPLPAGCLAYHNGRLLSAAGSRLYYSPAFNLGLHDPIEGFIDFGADISVVVPADNGVYVAAKQTHWLPGADISKVEPIADVLPYGAAAGTEFALPQQRLVGWYGARGLVIADTSGQAKAVQEDQFAAPVATSGAAGVVERAGARAVLVSLIGAVPSPLARA